MERSSSSNPDIAAVAAAVQRFQRLRASKTSHAILVEAASVDLTQQSLQLLVAATISRLCSEEAAAVASAGSGMG